MNNERGNAVLQMLLYKERVMILIANFFLTITEILVVDVMVALGQQKLQRNVAYPLVVVYPLLPSY